MKDKIIRQAFLCALTYVDESSKISQGLAQRVHIVYKEIFIILENVSHIDDFKKKLINLNTNPNDITKREFYIKIISEKIDYYNLKRLYIKLKFLAEFGRLLPYQGINYGHHFVNQSLDSQIKFLKNQLLKYKIKEKRLGKEFAIIICFRIDNKNRIRNILASLLSIHSQINKNCISIIMVNQDTNDKYKKDFIDYVDKYIFAQNSGDYNYAWSRNIGATIAKKSKYFVFWDGDIVVPNDTLSKIKKLFSSNVQCIIPYTCILNLNSKSTSCFVYEFLKNDYFDIVKNISAQIMYEVYGGIIAVTNKIFFDVGGQDERFEGWGDEDNNFYYRVYELTDVRRINIIAYHLDHPRPIMRINGEKINKRYINNPTNKLNIEIGNLKKYSEK